MMKGLRITTKDIAGFREHLILEERSAATIQKYIRDIKAFAKYAEGPVTRETVIAYKKHLQEHYAVRSVNSMLASINSLFVFLGWHGLKVKTLKLQQQVYCPEEKEMTKVEFPKEPSMKTERSDCTFPTGIYIWKSKMPLKPAAGMWKCSFLPIFCRFVRNTSLTWFLPYPMMMTAKKRVKKSKREPKKKTRPLSSWRENRLDSNLGDSLRK